jgi:CDP-diacylglycerol--serine O-phosphatidyltransferase
MVSNVRDPRFPPLGFRTLKGLLGAVLHLVILVMALWVPAHFLFPLGLTYLTYGVVRAIFLGLLDRSDGGPPVMEEPEHEDIPRGPRLTAPRRGVDER